METTNTIFSEEDLFAAHRYSLSNYDMLSQDKICGCFYCCKTFEPAKITEWVNDKKGKTAICPFCGIDSVIGESSGFPITEEFLKAMKQRWF
ncbi:MAG: cytoplasmic protein [Spirochaetaceae bacterium]|nr:cytoplasmic protein [Spirochaetaceae bacterium]